MMSHKRFHTIIAALTLLVAGLGAANWYLKPASARGWAIGMAAMPAIWCVTILVGRRRPLESLGERERRIFTGSVIGAGLILAASQGIKLVETLGDFDPDRLERVWGVCIGAVLVIIGNAIPKALAPLAAQSCSDSRAQSVRRFTGWSFVLAGVAYAIAWLALPAAQAGTVSTLACLSAVVLVALRCGWALTTSHDASSATRR